MIRYDTIYGVCVLPCGVCIVCNAYDGIQQLQFLQKKGNQPKGALDFKKFYPKDSKWNRERKKSVQL